MHLPPISLPRDPSSLTGKDLIVYESQLGACFGQCFTFKTHALRFPTTIPNPMIPTDGRTTLLAFMEKDRVHIPLQSGEKLLGIFVARGIDKKALTPMMDILPNIAALALDTVCLYRAAITDPLTGLHNHYFLQTLLETEITNVLASIMPGPESSADMGYRGCFGLIHLDMDRFTSINSRFGHCFGDTLLVDVGKAIQAGCPSQAHACRTAGAAFIVFWPQATPSRCRNLARALTEAITALHVESPISRESITLTASAGYANYPADMLGNQFRRSSGEQARIILEKAHKAALSAKTAGGDTVFSYKDILKQGAKILETLPLNRVLINAGSNLDLTEGMRFLVWPGTMNGTGDATWDQDALYPDMYKGEILVQEVREQTSVGEILFLNDPSWSPHAGDRLTLAEQQDPPGLCGDQPGEPPKDQDEQTVLGLREFILAWTRMRAAASTFVLALFRMLPRTDSPTSHDAGSDERFDALYASVRNAFGHCLAGRYSANTLICWLPDLDADTARVRGEELCSTFVQQTGVDLRIGMAGYPFFHCAKSEILDNARKALDHALLLPASGAILFDSISLTISADRMFTKGDFYAALEEYQRALGIDPDNLLARNSLGICYARLGRMEDAKKHFKAVVDQGGNDLMPLYNFGCACFKTGELDVAREAFVGCLSLDPSHVYALIRLGQLAEKNGDLQEAEQRYQEAGNTDKGTGMAARHLAKLAMDRGEQDKAREFLHQALVFDPGDAFALNMLAKLYLDRGEDPEIAEDLARQSVHLRPDVPSLWIEVARALETRGKKDEARTAHLRSRSGT